MKETNNKGFVFPTIVGVILILTITGLTFIYSGGQRRISVENKLKKTQAFWLAEAGLERTKEILKRDFLEGEGNWGSNNSILHDDFGYIPDNKEFNELLFETSFGKGYYTVALRNMEDPAGGSFPDEITARSTGIVGDSRRTIEADLRIFNFSPGESSIFGGGITGDTLAGNVTLCGSVYIGGKSVAPGDVVFGASGNAAVVNRYINISTNLENRISGGAPNSLRSTMWVKNGMIDISGTNQIGEVNIPMDGVYLPQAEDSIKSRGAAEIHSRRGIGYSTDFNDLAFPDIDSNFISQFAADAHVISGDVQIDSGEIIQALPIFSHNGSTLTINGKVFIDGNLTFAESTNYAGNGIILVSGSVEIKDNLLTDDFPETNVLTIVSQGEIKISGPNTDIMGSFYSDSSVSIKHPGNHVVGSIGAAEDFSIFNPLIIYQVPGLSEYLSEHIIDYSYDWQVLTGRWELVE